MSDIVHPGTPYHGGPIEDQFEVAIDAAVHDAAYYAGPETDVSELVETMETYLDQLKAWERGEPEYRMRMHIGNGRTELHAEEGR